MIRLSIAKENRFLRNSPPSHVLTSESNTRRVLRIGNVLLQAPEKFGIARTAEHQVRGKVMAARTQRDHCFHIAGGWLDRINMQGHLVTRGVTAEATVPVSAQDARAYPRPFTGMLLLFGKEPSAKITLRRINRVRRKKKESNDSRCATKRCCEFDGTHRC